MVFGVESGQAPLILGEKFHAVQINRPITNLPADANRFVRSRILELDLDLTAHRKVGRGKQADTAFAEPDPAGMDNSFVRRVIDHHAKLCVEWMALPSSSIRLLVHCYQLVLPTREIHSIALPAYVRAPRKALRRNPQFRKYCTVPNWESYSGTTGYAIG